MGYIGRAATNAGSVRYLDNISSGFDGSDVTFTAQVAGVSITPGQENINLYLDGVFQHPGSGNAYTISGSTITFTAAPVANTVFTAYVVGEGAYLDDATVITAKIGDDAITAAKLDDDGTGFQVGDLGVGGSLTSGDKLTVTGRLRASAGIIGALTGNATTATTLATARTIGGVSFDGSANIAVTLAATATTLATARAINGVDFNGSAAITVTAAAGTLSGATLKSTVTASSLTSVGTLTGLSVDGGTSSLNRGNSSGDILDVRGQNTSQMKVTTTAFTVTPNATFTGNLVASTIESNKNGSDSATSGAYLRVGTASGSTNVWMWQLGASNQFDLWNYNAGGDNAWEKALTFTTTNLDATFAGNILRSGSGDTTITNHSTGSGDPSFILNSAAANRNGFLHFKDQGNQAGYIKYTHNGDSMNFHTGNSGTATLALVGDNAEFAGTVATSGQLNVNNDAFTYGDGEAKVYNFTFHNSSGFTSATEYMRIENTTGNWVWCLVEVTVISGFGSDSHYGKQKREYLVRVLGNNSNGNGVTLTTATIGTDSGESEGVITLTTVGNEVTDSLLFKVQTAGSRRTSVFTKVYASTNQYLTITGQ